MYIPYIEGYALDRHLTSNALQLPLLAKQENFKPQVEYIMHLHTNNNQTQMA